MGEVAESAAWLGSGAGERHRFFDISNAENRSTESVVGLVEQFRPAPSAPVASQVDPSQSKLVKANRSQSCSDFPRFPPPNPSFVNKTN